MSNTIKRSDVQTELTWDLSSIYTSIEEFEKAFEECKQSFSSLTSAIEIMLDSSEHLNDFFKKNEDIARQFSKLYAYSHLNFDQDTTNTDSQVLSAKMMNLYTEYAATIAPVVPKFLSKSREEINALVEQKSELSLYNLYFDRIFKEKEHILSENEEKLLASASDLLEYSGEISSVLRNSDLKYPKIVLDNGEEVQITNGVYANVLETGSREKRKEVFEKLYSTYDSVKNSFASTLFTHLKHDLFKKNIRKYNSTREMYLSSNEVPESVYDTLLSVVGKNIHLLHDYVDFRKEILGVDTLESYDLYVPIVADVNSKYTIEQAKATTLKALAPLGEEYLSIIQKAFDERWIDWIENEGKRTGAYSSGVYDTNPFILMNWQDSINQLYTLVHELGHSVHSYYTRSTQPYEYAHYPIFLAEIASTTNEILLTDYLLKTETDPAVRAYIINHYLDGFKGTVFRQTQFAEFEYTVHQKVSEGTPLTHSAFSQIYKEINKKYYGSSLNSDSQIALEWARIPHFYSSFYVFQYATGFSAASSLASRILQGKEGAVEQYIGFLKSGNSDTPINIMKKAGVDMTQETYIEEALNTFKNYLEQLKITLK